MKRIIRLTENDLIKLVKRVIKEQPAAYDIDKNLSNKLRTLGFKYSRSTKPSIQHQYKYVDGGNTITVYINPTAAKIYTLVSNLVKPNYESHPGYEQSKFNMTYTFINKNYSEVDDLMTDINKSIKQIQKSA